jgi:hypothetical protein
MLIRVLQGERELAKDNLELGRIEVPFPPGPNAALARRICSACHSANTVARRRYDAEDARRLYRVMVTSDLESDTARRVISYLTTTLGDD